MRKHIIITSIFLSILLLCSCTTSNYIEPKESTEKPTEESSSTDIESNNLTESASEFVESNISTEKSTKYDDIIDSEDLEHIYFLKYGEVFSSPYNFSNYIVVQKSLQKPEENLQKTIVLNGVEHELTYDESIYSNISDKTTDCYFIDGNEKNIIRLCDGKIEFLAYNQMKINIPPYATPEEIFNLMKAEVSKVVDVSKYKYIKIPNNKNTDDFGSYDFKFYNSIDGIQASSLYVTVKDDGTIGMIKITGEDVYISDASINETLEQQAIELKLKEAYGEYYYSYKIFEGSGKSFILYKDELYIMYMIEPEIYKDNQIEGAYVEYIMIPLDMIRDN